MIKSQRDEFIEIIHKRAKKDKNICILSADFGAPALDGFIKECPKQFFHLGISEQNMVDVAIGLALKGKKVFCYAMAPFISLRCIEQHKTAGLMNLPIMTLVAGVGFGYADAGPTHYATEDYGALASLINSNIYTISDGAIASKLANQLCSKPEYSFIRMDRMPTPLLAQKFEQSKIATGYRFLNNGSNKCIISRGYMSFKVQELFKKSKSLKKYAHIDLFKSKPIPKNLRNILKRFKKIVLVDEQVERSSLSLPISHFMIKNDIKSNLTCLNLSERYAFENGGRDYLLSINGLSDREIVHALET
jgi:transketolase